MRGRHPGPLDLDDTDMNVPHPGLEPGLGRLEDDGSSIEHMRRRAERESHPPAPCCRRRSSLEIRLVERTAGIEPAYSAWKAAVLPLDDVREGALGGNRTRTAYVKNPFGKLASLPRPSERSPVHPQPQAHPTQRSAPVNIAHGLFRKAGSYAPLLGVPVPIVFPVPFPLGRPGRWNRRESNSHPPGANRVLSL